jgi:hypothetical protein
VDRDTVAIYERESAKYEAQRRPRFLPQAEASAPGAPAGSRSTSGVGRAGTPPPRRSGRGARRGSGDGPPGAGGGAELPGVQGDLGALPFRRGSLAAGWARNTYVHLRQDEIRWRSTTSTVLAPGGADRGHVFAGDVEGYEVFPTTTCRAVVLDVDEERACATCVHGPASPWTSSHRCARRRRSDRHDPRSAGPTLPDFVGAGMRCSCAASTPACTPPRRGSATSPRATGSGRRPLAAGLASRDRDRRHALRHDGMG